MARIRRDTDLGTREARRRLPSRPEPYFLIIERGLSLGYRKSAEGGAWMVRRFSDRLRRHFEKRIASADDLREADGAEVMTFAQAQRRALTDATDEAEQAIGLHYTVADAVRDYVEYLKNERHAGENESAKLKAYVVRPLGHLRVADLKPADFDDWKDFALNRAGHRRQSLLKRERAVAGALGKKADQLAKLSASDRAELLRRRKSTVNRVIAAFLACLNHAYARRRVVSRNAWLDFKKFRGTDAARLRWLSIDESRRLLEAAQDDLRSLLWAALLTGCREGELLAAQVRDFDVHSQTLLVAQSKSGKSRRVPLTDEGVTLFRRLVSGKSESAVIFSRSDGSPWYRMAVLRELTVACRAAQVAMPVTFYTLRHTYASHLIQQSTPMLYVASALGHRDARMVEKHYAHLAPSHVAATIRANLPSFGSVAAADTDKRRPARRARAERRFG